jgi:glycopeptide antibiotics resistance protein
MSPADSLACVGTYRINTIITVMGTVALLPLAMLPILSRVTRRYGALRGWPMFAGIGLLGSAVALAAFTVFPLPDPGTLQCTGASMSSYWQTEWFGSISLIGDAWAAVGFPAVLTSFTFLQVALNVLLFVPYGFFLHQVTRWRALAVVLFGLGTSVLIEATQGTGVFGLYPCPYRVLDVDDLICNTLGAAVGVLLSLAVARRFAWSRPAPVPDLARPTLARRVIAAGIDGGLILFVWAVFGVAWRLVADADGPGLLLGAVAAVLVSIALPLLRRDRATPGQVIVNVAPTRGEESADAPGIGAVLIRAVVRWTVLVVLGVFAQLAVAAAEIALVAATPRHSSLAGLIARTTTRTKPAMASGTLGESLPGGNMGGATRVGDVVRKPTQPQSATIQRLVRHVRAQGVTWVAEPLGIKGGFDLWRFIPGGVSHDDPHDDFPGVVVEEVARRLREWHDATVTFPRSAKDTWFWPGKRPDEVICHVDFAPYNHVFDNGRFVGAIDFDLCYPGPRLWDLAYTAYRYVPLTPATGMAPDAGRALLSRRLSRLDRFLAAYGGGDAALTYSREQLLGYVVPRLAAMVEWCEQQDDADRKRDAAMYREHAEFIDRGGYGTAAPVVVPDLKE